MDNIYLGKTSRMTGFLVDCPRKLRQLANAKRPCGCWKTQKETVALRSKSEFATTGSGEQSAAYSTKTRLTQLRFKKKKTNLLKAKVEH